MRTSHVLLLLLPALLFFAPLPSRAQSLEELQQASSDAIIAGRGADALPYLLKIAQIQEHRRGATALETLRAYRKYAQHCDIYGKPKLAEPAWQRLVAAWRQMGTASDEAIGCLQDAGAHYDQIWKYDEGLPLYTDAEAASERLHGSSYGQTIQLMIRLTGSYNMLQDMANSTKWFDRAQDAAENLAANDPAQMSVLAVLYVRTLYREGDETRVESLLQRMEACANVHPEFRPNFLIAKAQLALKKHHYNAAAELYEQSIEASPLVSKDAFLTAIFKRDIAHAYVLARQYDKALPYEQAVYQAYIQKKGENSREVAITELELGEIQLGLGEAETALASVGHALGVLQSKPAIESTIRLLRRLEVCCLPDLGRTREAAAEAAEVRRLIDRYVAAELAGTTEEERAGLVSLVDPYSLDVAIANADALAQTVLHYKGVVLDSLIEDAQVVQQSLDPKQRELVRQLREEQRHLVSMTEQPPRDGGPDELAEFKADREALERQVERTQTALSRQFASLGRARRAFTVSTAQVQAALPRHAALIELIRFKKYLGKDEFEAWYGAIVIPPQGPPQWVPLDKAASIDEMVHFYQSEMRMSNPGSSAERLLGLLYQHLWKPLAPALPSGTRQIIVSPDGQLNFVSFATILLPDGRFLGEAMDVTYVSTGRDLLHRAAPSSDNTMDIFANPKFDLGSPRTLASSGKTAGVPGEIRGFRNEHFDPLPGTEREFHALEKEVGPWSHIVAYTGAEATKPRLLSLQSPHVLHLATHGFFLPEIDFGDPGSGVPLANPMERSGLALAGAQSTIDAWCHNEVAPNATNGIVTADEVATMHLHGTWLVTLSACDTGSGEAKAGEGVLGLRRGFLLAGARNLLMTLWPISDEDTAGFMKDFYDKARQGHPGLALAATQRALLGRLRKEKGVATAATVAGPFILTFSGGQ